MNYPFQCPVCGHKHNMSKTNADRIRAMSDEELAYLLAHETFRIADPIQQRVGFGLTEEAIYACRLKWLRSPAKGE